MRHSDCVGDRHFFHTANILEYCCLQNIDLGSRKEGGGGREEGEEKSDMSPALK